MNYHALLDEATVRLGSALLGSQKFFAESIDAPHIGEVVADATVDLDREIAGATDQPTFVTADTPTGTYETGYDVIDWKRASLPTIIFHHGSGEDPFDVGRLATDSVSRIFADPETINANLIAVRAPYHDGSAGDYARAMGELADFEGMLASSTALVEALREQLVAQGTPVVLVSGISLGGWVTTLHRAYHDSAEMYAPIFAGDRLGEMFATSAYRSMTGELARENPETLRETLDFPDAYADATSACRPMLGRYDRIIELEVQGEAFADEDLAVIDYGHVTGSLQSGRLREYVAQAVVEAPGRTAPE